MNKVWRLQKAKSHLSEVVERAKTGKTQIITKHSQDTGVVIAYDRYLSLTGQTKRLLEVLSGEQPFAGDLPVTRDKGGSREVSFE